MKRLAFLLSSLLLALALAGCGSETASKEPAEPPPPPEPVTGREAYQKMYLKAKLWANDAELLQLSSIALEGVPEQPGKRGAWRGIFASPSKGRQKSITYSVIEGPGNLYQGVFEGNEANFSPHMGALTSAVAIKIDSDQAHEAAMEKAKAYVQKHPDMPIVYILETPRGETSAQWRVLWGHSVSSSNYSIFVDAATGKYLRTMY
jgi:hypothetical protein